MSVAQTLGHVKFLSPMDPWCPWEEWTLAKDDSLARVAIEKVFFMIPTPIGRQRFFEEAYRALAPGGTLHITCPSPGCVNHIGDPRRTWFPNLHTIFRYALPPKMDPKHPEFDAKGQDPNVWWTAYGIDYGVRFRTKVASEENNRLRAILVKPDVPG